jgi:hypothetical protein
MLCLVTYEKYNALVHASSHLKYFKDTIDVLCSANCVEYGILLYDSQCQQLGHTARLTRRTVNHF